MRSRLLLLMVLSLGGCTTQQLYSTGQSWQRQECLRLPDLAERDRCLRSTARSYEEFRSEAARAGGR
jgi:hypothetical protein